MSNRLYNQFSYSPERQPVSLSGKFIQASSVVYASLLDQGITYTAIARGAAGNDVTIRIIVPAGNGALSVVTTDNAIVVTLEKALGVVVTDSVALAEAINDSSSSVIVRAVSDGSTDPLVGLAITHLAGGADPIISTNGMNMSMTNPSDDHYVLLLQDEFPEVLSAQVTTFSPQETVQAASIIAVDTAFGGDKTVTIKTTQLPVNDGMFVSLILRNSSNP